MKIFFVVIWDALLRALTNVRCGDGEGPIKEGQRKYQDEQFQWK